VKDAIDGPMTIVAPFTFLTAETIGSQLVRLHNAGKCGDDTGQSPTEPYRNSHSVVIHSQPQPGNEESMKPSTRLLG